MSGHKQVLFAKVGRAAQARRRDPDNPQTAAALADARRELYAESIAEFVAKTVAKAPPLTAEQRARIVSLLSEAS